MKQSDMKTVREDHASREIQSGSERLIQAEGRSVIEPNEPDVIFFL